MNTTPIFVITLIVKREEEECPRNTRCIGWFHTLIQARYAFRVDRSHMSSCLYTHGVIEKTVPGIYPSTMTAFRDCEMWYLYCVLRANGGGEGWAKIPKPAWGNNITGWGIG